MQEEASLERGIIKTLVQGLLGIKDPISGARLGASIRMIAPSEQQLD